MITPAQFVARQVLQEAESLQPGDRVTYSRAFLRSSGIYSGDMAFREGTVQSLRPFRKGGGATGEIAKVKWDDASDEDTELNPGVLVTNLCRVNKKHLEPR